MGFHFGTEDIHGIRLRHRGMSAFQNKYGTFLLIKQDGRLIYREQTERLMTADEIKGVIDSIKDFDYRKV